MAGKSEETFSEDEATRRLEAALRGARLAGHKPMSAISSKRSKPRKKKKPAGAR